MASATSRHCSPRNTEPSDYLTLDPTSQHVGCQTGQPPDAGQSTCSSHGGCLYAASSLLRMEEVPPGHLHQPVRISWHQTMTLWHLNFALARSTACGTLQYATLDTRYHTIYHIVLPAQSDRFLPWTGPLYGPLSLHALEPAFCHPTFWTHPCHYAPHGQSSDLERPFIPDPPYALAPPARAEPMARPSTWRIFLPAFGISVRHISQQRTPEHLTSSSSSKPANDAAYGHFMELLPLSAPAPRWQE